MSWLVACQPDATPRAKEAKEELDKFYTRYTIRGGWGFFGSEAKDKDVVLEINVPDKQADDLLKLSEYERMQFAVRNACPPRSEQVWSIMDPEGDVVIHLRHSGNRFITVSCKKTT
jgi:hypothetical protein